MNEPLDLKELMLCYTETFLENYHELNNILNSDEYKKNYVKIWLNVLSKYLAIKSNINFRYKQKENIIEHCQICNQQFYNSQICRSTFKNIDNTCKCIFHAKCICNYLNTHKTEKCPICNLEIPDKLVLPKQNDEILKQLFEQLNKK